MSEKKKQIIPIGGGGFYRDPENLELEKYVIRQSGAENVRVCFVPTASGEPDHYVASFYSGFLKLGCRPSALTFSSGLQTCDRFCSSKMSSMSAVAIPRACSRYGMIGA